MITKRKIDEHEFTFVNTWKSTRNGFAHLTELYKDDYCIATSRCNYLNRTWESYEYQSVMRAAVYNLLQRITARIELDLKSAKGWKVLTRKRKELVTEYRDKDKNYQLYNSLYESL